MLYNATLIFVPMVLGAVYSKKKLRASESFKYWVMALCTLIIYYAACFLVQPWRFTMWRLWGVFFPIIASTSVLLAGIVFSLLLQPYLLALQKHLTPKQNLLGLSLLTLAGFALSAGTLVFDYSIYGLYLVLFFSWGMFLANVKIPKKAGIAAVGSGIVSFFVILVGVPGFDAVYWSQRIAGRVTTSWNSRFLSNPTSPFLFIMAAAAFILFKRLIVTYDKRQMRLLAPVIIFMDAPIAAGFMNSFRITGSSKVNKLIMIFVMLIVSFGLTYLYDRWLFNFKPLKKITAYLDDEPDLFAILETAWNKFAHFVSEHRVNLLTWGWFYCLSFASFLIEADKLRIQISTAADINALVYLLGTRFFAIILTTIFLDALFTILYFVTTRYWVSNILVSMITIGWAIANKVKLNFRGEPIYPTELSEVVNWKTLLPMVGKTLLIVVAVAIVVIICLMVFLEKKVPVKKLGSVKSRGIWAMLSLFLFITPLWFNHDGGIISRISHGFDNKQSFRNPERDIQINGPVLNVLNYIDLQIMTRPSDYSETAISQLDKKYAKVAAQINASRTNNLKDQTIVFNLSESFTDPYTFPTIKIDKAAPNPVKYIQSLKNTTTYGSMLSAGYGGGTANMEWETLTGLNMGLFKSSALTPYVQIVPNYTFYPTIGMNFPYKSAVHPFIGSYYSRVEDYHRFKFDKFAYLGSKYKIIDQKKLGKSTYNSDFTAYANGLAQINDQAGGQFINLISIQNHMPYNNWYPNNVYEGKITGDLFNSAAVRDQMATYVKGVQYTDQAVKKFIGQIDKINKPITLVFYGDHYPSVVSQSYTAQYPVQMHSTRYFIYSNKYAREHGAKAKLTDKASYINTSEFIPMMLEQTNSKVTPYQALLTEIHRELPAITINFDGDKGFELINGNGKVVDPKKLTKKQQELLKDYELIQYDMTAGKAYGLKVKGFYK